MATDGIRKDSGPLGLGSRSSFFLKYLSNAMFPRDERNTWRLLIFNETNFVIEQKIAKSAKFTAREI